METLKLQAKIRTLLRNKVDALREQGVAPAVVYGKAIKPISLEIDAKEFMTIYKKAGDNTVIDLTIMDDKNHKVLIQKVQLNPTQDKLMHIEFLAISLTDKVKVHIPLHPINMEIAEKLGGIIVKALSEVEVEALPTDLPHQIEIDCSVLQNFGDTIHVKDLKVDSKIKILSDLDLPVVSFDEPAKEEVIEEKAPEVATESEKTEENKEGEKENESKE